MKIQVQNRERSSDEGNEFEGDCFQGLIRSLLTATLRKNFRSQPTGVEEVMKLLQEEERKGG